MANHEEEFAVAQIKASAIKKQVNAASWNDDYENLLASWGEKAAGLRYMHGNSSGYWRGVSNNLTLYSIVATTIASAASLVAGSIDDIGAKDAVLFAAGGVGLITSFIQSLKKFYNADEKAAEHGAVAKQFGSYYRYITLQMGMSREDRRPSDELSEWALKEFERLQLEALPLRGADVQLYKKTFKASNQAMPDNCRTDYAIKIYNRREPESFDYDGALP
jgi:hypothetical protein|tara:strand:+ start:4949 stop:5608 length:660 start_codon:yes stop_codon:yes gene_type:complete